MSAASTALSEDQKAILKELGTRQESFSLEQKAVYQELSRRMGSSYSGRPLSTLMSSNTPRTKAEQEQVDYALHHRQGVGLDEISGALATTLPAGRAVAVGVGNALKGTAKMAAGGYLGSKAAEEGARALHLPTWAQGAAQVVGAIYGAKWAGFFPEFVAQTGSISPGKFFQWMRARGEPIPGPYPVGKGTRTKYGGPAPVESGPSGKLIPRGKFTPPAEPVPETPEPYPAGKGTSTKYGGPTEPDFSPPARKLKLKGGPKQGLYPNAPEPEVAPKAPKPFKPSPAIARKLRFGGPTKEEYTPPPTRTIRGRTGAQAGESGTSPKTEQGSSAQTLAATTRPEPPASVRSGHAGEDKPALRGAAEDVVHRNAQAKDLKMVEYFKSKGIDPDAISDADFNKHLAANGFKPAPAKYDPKLMRRAMSAVRADIRALMKKQ